VSKAMVAAAAKILFVGKVVDKTGPPSALAGSDFR
jgi:hypothetical protein